MILEPPKRAAPIDSARNAATEWADSFALRVVWNSGWVRA
jgi:hypothetical protein